MTTAFREALARTWWGKKLQLASERGMQEENQKITDEFIVEIDRLIDAKEKDLLVI